MKKKHRRDLAELIHALIPVVYPALKEEYTPDCCIAAASILVGVFGHYGYKAEVVPVEVHIFNPVMLDLLEKGTEFPKDREERERFFDMTGAWGVGIVPKSAFTGLPVPEGRFGGHLLVKVGRWVVDATIQQAQRPDKKIPLPAMITSEHSDELIKTGKLSLGVGQCGVIYRRINDESYRTAPDWVRRSTPYPETVRKILARTQNGHHS